MKKKEDKSGLFIPAGLFLGMGLGFLLGNFIAWFFIGFAAGFVGMAIAKYSEKS